MKTVLHLERKFTSKTETFIVNQINSIKNFNVIVATIQNTGLLYCNKKIITPEKVSHISKTAKFLSFKTAKILFEQLRHYDISLIHTHFVIDAWFFLKLTNKFDVPKIVSGYGHDVSRVANDYFGIGKYMLKKAINSYDLVLAMSEDMKNDIMKLGCESSKIRIHYYGTDVNKFIYPNRNYSLHEPITILQVGTLEAKKAQDIVLEALFLLKTQYNISNFLYICIGEGDLLPVLIAKINDLNLNDNVKILGYLKYGSEQHINAYKNADIFIHPSVTLANYEKEGIPGTIVEAMASGLPVISTYHAGIPYIIQNEKEGLLVKERDVEGLANALRRLIENKELRMELGRNAQRKAVEELDLYKGTERLEKIYEELIFGRR